MEWLDSLIDWGSRNWDTISNVVDKGRQLYNLYDANTSRQGARGDILDFMRQQEAQDNAYQQQLWAYRNAQSGRAAAAARANDAARRKFAKKAFKQQSKMLKELIAQYQPYTDAAKTLTPKMTQNYSQFLDTTSLLNQYLTPKVMDTLGSAPKPAFEQNIPKSAYAVAMPQSAPIQFLSPEEALKRK